VFVNAAQASQGRAWSTHLNRHPKKKRPQLIAGALLTSRNRQIRR
jgi:hypothetical protein